MNPFLGKLFGKATNARPTAGRPRPRAACTLALRQLEDRTVPSTFTVTNLHDGGAGSLRQAVASADAHHGADVIRFASGLHGTIALTGGQLNITDDLTVAGLGAGQVTVSGNNSSRVFDISNHATATISGLTIADGRVIDDVGGGVRNEAGSTLNLVADTVANNTAYGLGGGVRNEMGATLTVSNSAFVGNKALGSLIFSYDPEGFSAGDGTAEGGAIYTDGTATVLDSTFTGNLAAGAAGGAVGGGKGGAIGADGDLTVTGSSFTGNVARGADGVGGGAGAQAEGGAIDIAVSTTVAVDSHSVFTDNQALGGSGGAGAAGADGGRGGTGAGGAVSQADATLTLIDSVFAGNEAIGGVGGAGGIGGAGGSGGTGRGGAFVHTVTFGSSTPLSNLSNVAMLGNEALGGSGGAGGVGGNGGDGGAGQGGGIRALLGTIDIDESLLLSNHATGGAGGVGGAGGSHGGSGGAGQGGALLATFGVVANISQTAVLFNDATGCVGARGGDGGDGLGGGVYVDGDSPFGKPTVAVTQSVIAFNQAGGGRAGAGGGAAGAGLGRDLYNAGVVHVFDSIVGDRYDA